MPIEGLPDDLKGNESLASFNTPADLAQAYLKASDWKAGLTPELKAEKSLESFKDVGSLAKSYVEGQKMIGGSVRIPKDDAPPEEWQKFYARMGTPESPDKYEFNRPALGEGVAWDENFEKKVLTEAHAHGLNSKQVQWLMNLQAGYIEEQLRGVATKREETVTALKKDWGDDFERRMNLAGRARNLFIDKGWITEDQANSLFDGKGIGDDPVLLTIMHRLGEIFAEDGWIKGETGAQMMQGLEAQIKAIRSDPNDPFNKKDDPRHEERVKYVDSLYARLYPKK